MAVQRRFHAFQNDPNIAAFLVEGSIVTGRQLGVGSYGSVEEVSLVTELASELQCVYKDRDS